MGEAFDEGAIEIEKAYCPSYFGDVFGRWPCVYARDFYQVHACHPLFKDYPQVIHRGCMERAFFWFEVEVVIECDLEYVTNCGGMFFHVGACRDANVIHVYSYGSPLKFMLEDGVSEDIVHHGLEHRWGIGESKVHDCGFKETVPCLERCLSFVSFLNSYVVVSPLNIQFCVDVGITEVSYKVGDKR